MRDRVEMNEREIRALMWKSVGLFRDRAGLRDAVSLLHEQEAALDDQLGRASVLDSRRLAAREHRDGGFAHRQGRASARRKPRRPLQHRFSGARRSKMEDSRQRCGPASGPVRRHSMKQSKLLLQTYREAPRDADVVSQQLMMRGGMIQKVAAGIYDYLPLALRSIRKFENIVREELERDGAQELLMPTVQPGELWQESGRWQFYGRELLRFKDRKGADFCLGPTHEEIVTDIVRKIVKSYKQLPINLFQIQIKFRDEIRPRFGLMRGREFIMKDGYSFHVGRRRCGPRILAHVRGLQADLHAASA